MNQPITMLKDTSLRLIGSVSSKPIQGAGIEYLTIESLIEYCRVKLKEADAGIQNAMSGLDDITKAQQSLANLKSAKFDTDAQNQWNQAQTELGQLKNDPLFGNHPPALQAAINAKIKELEEKLPALEERMKAFDAQVEETCKQLEAVGQSEAAKAVRNAAAGAKTTDKEALDKFQKVIDAQSSTIGASREMAMVRLQALVSQRGTMLQMITNTMNSLNEAPKAIAGNLRA